MRNSKSDLFFALGLAALLCGCDALRVPVPEDPDNPLRASFTGFVGKGVGVQVHVARPLDNSDERFANLPWIDEAASRMTIEQRLPSGATRTLRLGFYGTRGLAGSAGLLGYSDLTLDRLRGLLRWNASAPFTFSDDGMLSDSFDLHPQQGAKVRILRDRVRGDISLRWPKLALAAEDSLFRWSRIPDSVVSFQTDWIALSLARGDSGAKLLLLDTSSRPFTYRWNNPDTSVLRRVLRGETAYTFFSAGDSIWIPVDRGANLLVNLDTSDSNPALLDQNVRSSSVSTGFLMPSASYGTTMEGAAGSPMWFVLRDRWGDVYVPDPLRVVLQVAGTCPAFAQWRRYGSTDRWHRPTGNVAPFDGYLCEIFPDTVSFPRGDVVLTKPDTSTGKEVFVVPSKNVTLQPVRP